ncbi:hypothetical protein BYT27DRAFT_7256942 [Phlegmacium glaucopus]|nr:hypothetical protein BYT27DRAFT_7256942 [Phlegmacium glaucopus]
MPTEIAFKKHAEETREALKNFNAIRILKAPDLTNFALNTLVGFNDFVPGFISNPLFQEIPPVVQNTINDFCTKNPGVPLPELTHRIAGLVARIKDSLPPPKKAAIAAANVRPEKGKKVKPATTKHPCLSKETVDSDDDEITAFLNAPIQGPSNIPPVVPKVTILTQNSDPTKNILVAPMDVNPNVFISSATVRIPYALVPGMSITSPLFYKALSVLSKQQPVPGTEQLAPTITASLGLLNETKQVLMQRARNIVTDSTITEIICEDPQGHTELQHYIHHHVVAFCQHVCVSLLVIDNLMSIYNSSLANTQENLL